VFQTQLHLLGELNEHINYVGKGVDKYDPVPPFYRNIVLDYIYVEVWSLMRYLSTFVGVAQQGSLY
jgi:hypothetical protein